MWHPNQWHGSRLWQLQCWCTGVVKVLSWAMDMIQQHNKSSYWLNFTKLFFPYNNHRQYVQLLILSLTWESPYLGKTVFILRRGPGGRFKNAYELLNLRALKISMLYKSHIFQCMSMIFCVEFQRVPLKFHTKYHTHTLKDVDFIRRWKFKSS